MKAKKEIVLNLPKIRGLMSMAEPGIHYGMIEFNILKGRMIAWNLLDEHAITVFHANISANSIVNWHNHNNSWERIICIQGLLEIEYEDGTKVLIKPGEELKIGVGVVHKACTFKERTWIVAINVPKE